MPATDAWDTFHRWSQQCGSDILYINVVGQGFLILDSLDIATELLEKRSGIYSSRPRMPMVKELMGWDFAFAFTHGESWRKERRLMHQTFSPAAVLSYQPQMLRATHKLLNRFLDAADLMGNLRHMTGGIILSVTYGIEAKPKDDPLLHIAEEAVSALTQAVIAGKFLVDTLPWLKYVPEWVPGAGFKRLARQWKALTEEMIEHPFEISKKNIAEGYSESCFLLKCFQEIESGTTDNAYNEKTIKAVAGTMYAAGADTTVAAISTCILGLLELPDVLKKAQEEIDRVIRPGHLPDFGDQDNLPLITAIVLETLRWRPVGPIPIPRQTYVEDEFRGYRIPSGTIILTNAWNILHNPEIYPDPERFDPERFIKDGKLNPDVPHPDISCWGYGRRICPGRHLAFQNIWITIANLVAVFDITKSVDKDGRIIEPSHEYFYALTYMPKPFPCSIIPRSKEAEGLIRACVNQDV